MRMTIQPLCVLVLTVAAVSAVPGFSQGATDGPAPPRAELALGYSYLHGNAPPGGCGCFNLNGGNATFAWPLKTGRFAMVGDATIAHADGISSSGYGLTLSTYTVGARFMPPIAHWSLQPFGQALIGLAHSGGTLVQGQAAKVSNAGAAFAANLGGGLDLRLSRRFSWRVVEADYLLTTFDNGSNDHQNNLRISAGAVFHF